MTNAAPFLATRGTLKWHSYILLCQLFATEEFSKLTFDAHAPDVFNDLLGIEEQELNKNVMMLAALGRSSDDALDGLTAHNDKYPNGVGTLQIENVISVLSAREACNKIIHAQDAQLVFRSAQEHPMYAEIYKSKGIVDDNTYRLPFFRLNGTLPGKNGKAWNAEVNLIQWVLAVTYFTSL
jgi:hypothetical protein